MGAIRHLAAAAFLVLAAVSSAPGFAEEGVESRLASLGNSERTGYLQNDAAPADTLRRLAMNPAPGVGCDLLMQADLAARQASSAVETAVGSGRRPICPSPAVSLDRRVPAAQVSDPEGLSLIGVMGVVGELRHAFSRKSSGEPGDGGVARVVRTLRDSVFGKRISILSESGRMVENDPYLVGLSFTH